MKALAEQISDIDGVNIYGRVVGVRGLMVEIAGPIHAMSVGARIVVETGNNRFIPCEVIGFTGNNAVVMPFAGLDGVRRGCRAVLPAARAVPRSAAAPRPGAAAAAAVPPVPRQVEPADQEERHHRRLQGHHAGPGAGCISAIWGQYPVFYTS